MYVKLGPILIAEGVAVAKSTKDRDDTLKGAVSGRAHPATATADGDPSDGDALLDPDAGRGLAHTEVEDRQRYAMMDSWSMMLGFAVLESGWRNDKSW